MFVQIENTGLGRQLSHWVRVSPLVRVFLSVVCVCVLPGRARSKLRAEPVCSASPDGGKSPLTAVNKTKQHKKSCASHVPGSYSSFIYS